MLERAKVRTQALRHLRGSGFMRRQLIAGNWKMNCLSASARELASSLAEKVSNGGPGACDWAVCPPSALLPIVAEALGGSVIALGAQDCHAEMSGAHTGDTSAELLKDLGCRYVIVGHSERRADDGESDNEVKAKAEAALKASLTPIICVGETREQRDGGTALQVVEGQLHGSLPDSDEIVVAYEPVWAIGTGLTATPSDVAEVHSVIHKLLCELRGVEAAKQINILYGGSVKPGNAAELLAVPHVGGALVGGASLNAGDFFAIGVNAAKRD